MTGQSVANDMEPIVSLHPRLIDHCNVYGKAMVQDIIYKKPYKNSQT